MHAGGRLDRPPDIDGPALTAVLRRAFGDTAGVAWERTAEGVSAQVYRIRRGSEIFYLRLAEQPGQDLRVDAELHGELRRRGVYVPEVVLVEPLDAELGRSWLLMREIAGTPIASLPPGSAAAREIARAAGRELARLNQVPVAGFGWVRRDVAPEGGPLRGELASHADFVISYLPSPWPGRLALLFTPPHLSVLEAVIARERAASRAQAWLAHGDFDATQIFQHDGRYTGIIDLGEIRGAEPLFDLGHFLLWRGDGPTSHLPAVLDGYREVTPLPEDHGEAIARAAVLLGLRQLCRWLDGPRRLALDPHAVVARVQRLRELLPEIAEARPRTGA